MFMGALVAWAIRLGHPGVRPLGGSPLEGWLFRRVGARDSGDGLDINNDHYSQITDPPARMILPA